MPFSDRVAYRARLFAFSALLVRCEHVWGSTGQRAPSKKPWQNRVDAHRNSTSLTATRRMFAVDKHAHIIKTCTPVGTLREVAVKSVATMHAHHVYLRMSGSTIICKTQWMVNSEHRLAARSGAQVRRHKTQQNRWGAVYAAANVSPLALLSMWRRSPRDRAAIHAARWLRGLAFLHFENRHLWPGLAP